MQFLHKVLSIKNIEIHRKDDFAGKFLGDVFKHGKTLGVEFGTVFIGSGLEVGFGHGGSWGRASCRVPGARVRLAGSRTRRKDACAVAEC